MGSKPSIKNLEELLGARRGVLLRVRRHALRAVERAVESVLPRNALKRALRRRGKILRADRVRIDLSIYERLIVLGAGKACIGMAEYVEKLLGDLIDDGLIVVPRELHEKHKLKLIKSMPSTHPIPSELGVKASEKIFEYAEGVDEKTLVIFLLSGGASALLSAPADPVSITDLAEITKLLLASGATIDEINAVRKHLSRIKGGWLAKRLSKARTLSLIISDVVGDKLETIGSGPTSPDPTPFRDAYEIMNRYGIWDKAPGSVRSRIEQGLSGVVEETPKPDDPAFKRVTNLIVASIADACKAADRYLRARGYRSRILTRFMVGEASEVGRFMAGLLKELSEKRGRHAILAGGETTVTVRGQGLGGRNQELALSASINIRGLKSCCLLSVGTDGIDGPTDAAGAIVDGETFDEALRLGLNPILYLGENDSYSFFKTVGGLVFLGATGTNVGDLVILLKSD